MNARRRWSRRETLWLGGGAAAALAVGCGGATSDQAQRQALAPQFPGNDEPETPAADVQPSPTPAATPPPKGREERMLMAGTPSETRLHIASSGLAGPVLMILGGVHGNEPGGWGAADEIATWEPARGRMLVLPHANTQAIALFERTTDALGDLNRLYPGNPESDLPMERMAAEIVGVAREFAADIVLDLHESWAFYVEYPGQGTAALGQTVTWGIGPRNPDFGRALLGRANGQITVERDRLIERDGSRFRRSDGSSVNGDTTGTRGRSSLSLGGHVPGCTPILVEMGQMEQPVARRVELHQIVVRAALDELQM